MQEVTIQRGAATVNDLKITMPELNQEFCAVTYLLLPGKTDCQKCSPEKQVENTASSNVYGVFKVICTGPTMEAVEGILKKMFNDGRLDVGTQFVSIIPTGRYRYLHPGGDPHNAKDVYNTKTQEMIFSEHQKRLEHQKKQMNEYEERMKEVKEAAKREEAKDPASFEVYAGLRVKESSIKSWMKEQERIMAQQKKNLVETTKKRQQLDKTHPLNRIKFDKELKNPPKEDEETAETDIDEAKTMVQKEESEKEKEEL